MDFNHVVRWMYIQEAKKTCDHEGGKFSLSRIEDITGITRKEIGKLINEPSPIEMKSDYKQPAAAKALFSWYTEKQYLNKDGLPSPLPLKNAKPSFEDLVKNSCGSEKPYRTILKDLVSMGCVEENDEGEFYPIRIEYVPCGSEPEQLERNIYLTASHVGRLLNTCRHNLENQGDDSLLELSTDAQEIREEDYLKVMAEVSQRTRDFLIETEKFLISHKHKEIGRRNKKTVLLGLGTYAFLEDLKDKS